MNYNLDYIYQNLYDITLFESKLNRKRQTHLRFTVWDNAYVLPNKDPWKDGMCYGGVVSEFGDFVMSSAWHEGKRCDKYDFDESLIQTIDQTAIYIGFFNPVWGHAITDNLKKLWFLESDYCKDLLAQGAQFVYVSLDNKQMPDYVCRLFELAGVNISCFNHIKKIVRFKKIVVPDNSFIADNGERFYTNEYKCTIDRIKSNIKRQGLQIDKLYFSRTKLSKNRDFGEKRIEKFFRDKGYQIVYPENHTVDEQIEMLSSCKNFASTEGSISHNVVFCSKDTDVVVIRKCYDVNKYQMAVNSVSDINVTYIDAHRSTKSPKCSPWVGPFFIYVNGNMKKWAKVSWHLSDLYSIFDWFYYQTNDCKLIAKVRRKLFR